MEIYHDIEKISEDVRAAIFKALKKHDLADAYSAVAVCAVLEAVSSAFKKIQCDGRLAEVIGFAGTSLYLGSILLAAVERIRSPHSLSVNPIMDCIVLALCLGKIPMPDDLLSRSALKIYLNKSRLSAADRREHLGENKTFSSSFESACRYLTESGVIEKSQIDDRWRLTERFASVASDFRALHAFGKSHSMQ